MTRKTDENRFYVYVLYRQDVVTPFYIGKGTGKRMYDHERPTNQSNAHKTRIIKKMLAAGLKEIPKAKLFENLTSKEAGQIERRLIVHIGRWPNGPLVNLTDGGEGMINPSQETRRKLSIAALGKKLRPLTTEQKQKISQAVRGFKHTAEARAKISARSKLQKMSAENKAKLIASRIGAHHTPEARAKMGKGNLGRIKTLEEISKRVAKIIGKRHSKEAIEKMKKAQSNRSVEWLENLSKAAKAAHARRRQSTHGANALPSLNEQASQPPPNPPP